MRTVPTDAFAQCITIKAVCVRSKAGVPRLISEDETEALRDLNVLGARSSPATCKKGHV